MSRFRALITAGMLAALVPLTGATAAVEPDHDLGTLAPEESATWTGEPSSGTNVNYFGLLNSAPPEVAGPTGTCSKDPRTTCSLAVVEFSNPMVESDTRPNLSRPARVRIDADKPSDLDLVVYALEEDGTRGAELARSGCPCLSTGNYDGMYEEAIFSVRTTKTQPTVKVLIEVVYFAAAATGYHGQVSF